MEKYNTLFIVHVMHYLENENGSCGGVAKSGIPSNMKILLKAQATLKGSQLLRMGFSTCDLKINI